MIRSLNVSAYEGACPGPGANRQILKIKGGPLYPAAAVRALAESGNLVLWSNGARRDAVKWGLDLPDIAELVCAALDGSGYRDSEWCLQHPGGPWAACDAYMVTRAEWNDRAQKALRVTWYLKIAISKAGTALLSVSNHPEGT